MALLAAYSFDEESGDVLDASGNGRHWSLNNNGVRVAGGHTGRGLGKDGVGMPIIATPAFGQTTARTFAFWQQNLGDAVWWLRWWTSSGDTGTWGLYNVGGSLNLRCRKGGTNTNTTIAAPASGWHHYAGTYDGTNARLYVDGVLVATSAAVIAPLDSAERIDLAEGTLANFVMDDLRIYDEVLDAAAITVLMNTPVTDAPIDITGSATGTGGGAGAATGDVEVPGVAVGTGGGIGAATGTREAVGVATGAGGGVGHVLVVPPVSRGGSHALERTAPSAALLERRAAEARGVG
jgi:hypothetical protein